MNSPWPDLHQARSMSIIVLPEVLLDWESNTDTDNGDVFSLQFDIEALFSDEQKDMIRPENHSLH